jgi:hypothetical protein
MLLGVMGLERRISGMVLVVSRGSLLYGGFWEVNGLTTRERIDGLTAREKVDGLTAYSPSGSSILSYSTSACNSGSNN